MDDAVAATMAALSRDPRYGARAAVDSAHGAWTQLMRMSPVVVVGVLALAASIVGSALVFAYKLGASDDVPRLRTRALVVALVVALLACVDAFTP